MIVEVVANKMVSITLQTDCKKYMDEASYVIPSYDPCNYYEAYSPNLEFLRSKAYTVMRICGTTLAF